jgi:transcriptional regulator with XRE-family HTH domain
MTKVKDLHQKWMKNKDYRKAHEELAQRMDTSQSVIARLESGRTRPSTQTLERLAIATGTRLHISFEPSGVR